MIQSYFKIAYRHLTRSKVISSINVLGLTVGIAAFLVIAAYINFELSFDQFQTNKDDIYRIGLNRNEHGELVEGSAKTFPGIRGLIHHHFQEVKSFTGFYKTCGSKMVNFC